MWRMPALALISSAKEEIHDLLSYITVLERKLLAADAAEEMKPTTTKER